SADVIYVIDGGRVVESGDHATLLARGGDYATLYEQQFGGGRFPTDGAILAAGTVEPVGSELTAS
ncbi:MAG: Lipid export ATP-binding/permease protein MsbA, partial [Mycobacterium sp.]|nr:Lipid export ATP-binding/permease protein MsbA [Mycobacterium sp.]